MPNMQKLSKYRWQEYEGTREIWDEIAIKTMGLAFTFLCVILDPCAVNLICPNTVSNIEEFI